MKYVFKLPNQSACIKKKKKKEKNGKKKMRKSEIKVLRKYLENTWGYTKFVHGVTFSHTSA